MCIDDKKSRVLAAKARGAALRQRPEFLQALRMWAACRNQRLAANTAVVARQSNNTQFTHIKTRKDTTRDTVHNNPAHPIVQDKSGEIQLASPAVTPLVTARMIQSVSLGLSHVQHCDGCEHPVCLKTREMLRKVLRHKQTCSQESSTCKACELWERTVQLHHKMKADSGETTAK